MLRSCFLWSPAVRILALDIRVNGGARQTRRTGHETDAPATQSHGFDRRPKMERVFGQATNQLLPPVGIYAWCIRAGPCPCIKDRPLRNIAQVISTRILTHLPLPHCRVT